MRPRWARRPFPVLFAAALLCALLVAGGCTAQKQARVRRIIEQAGPGEPGTTVHWVRGPGIKGEKAVIANPEGQWAVSARASSSYAQFSDRPGFTAAEAAGPPDVPQFGFDGRAWGPSRENAGYEWLELSYATPVHASGVAIRETHMPGSVAMVQLRDTSGKYHLKWKGTDRPNTYLTWMVLDFPATSYLAKTVRITLDTTRVVHWKEIDAVQLAGKP